MKEEEENEELDPYTQTAMEIESRKLKDMVR
jgi:hypothetical protein